MASTTTGATWSRRTRSVRGSATCLHLVVVPNPCTTSILSGPLTVRLLKHTDEASAQGVVKVPKAKKKAKGGGTSQKAAQNMATWNAAAADVDAAKVGNPINAAGFPQASMADFEIKNTSFETKKAPEPKMSPPRPAQPAPAPPSAGAKPAAAKTAFICYLCNRKFNSQEMLSKHERLSDLHKKNLELAAAKEKNRA